MQCEKFEQRLHQLLDRRLSPAADDALLAHAHVCGACRELLDAQQALLGGLELLETPPTSPDFSQRVVRRLVVERRARAWRRAAYFLGGLAAGIVMAIVVLPPGRQGETQNDARGNRAPARDSAKSKTGANSPALAQHDESPSPVEIDSMVDRTANSPTAISYAELLATIQRQPEELVAAQQNGDRYLVALEDWGNKLVTLPRDPFPPDSLPGGLKPLAESLGSALVLLQATLADEPPSSL